MKRLFLILLPLLLAACTAAPTATQPPAPVPTRSSSPTPPPASLPTARPASPSPSPTPLTVPGILTIKVNLRSGPGTDYASLGLLDAGSQVQILLQDSSGAWYLVLAPSAPSGQAWLAARYVTVAVGTLVPVMPTPTASGPSGRVLQRLNVRSGPATSFTSIGMLDPDTLVSLTGKDSTASWFQIDYPNGPAGRAWVTAQYIQTDSSDLLPVLDDFGTPVPSGTPGPSPIPVTPTPTLGLAYLDADSAAHPSVNVDFSATGTREFTYSGQVSAPDGDPEDWLEFTPFSYDGVTARLLLSLDCSGNAALSVELWQAGSALSGWGSLACGDQAVSLSLSSGQPYQLHLQPAPTSAPLRLVDYSLTVHDLP